MIDFPNAKINIGLNIVEKRKDGFHNLESIFVPVYDFHDVLEVIPVSGQTEKFIFTSSGIEINGNSDNNLVIKAYKLLDKHFNLPTVKIHLHKCIPTGAGLGGGSADAAFMLKMLNKLFQLNINKNKLLAFAEELGSDCPFFINNIPQYASGKGEVLKKVDLFIPTSHLVIVKPDIHIPTKDAFAEIKPQKPVRSVNSIIDKLPNEWENYAVNDFEKSIFPKYPRIKEIKDKLTELGAQYTSMSGSGSSVYGFFVSKPHLRGLFKNDFIWQQRIAF